MNFERQTICEVLLARFAGAPETPAYYVENGDNGFRPVTYGECRELVFATAAGLISRGIRPGDCVGLLSDVRMEWTNCDFSNLLIRSVTVGIYPTSTSDQVEYILNHSRARLLIIDRAERLTALRDVVQRCPDLESIVLMDGHAPAEFPVPVLKLASLLEEGRSALAQQGEGPVRDEALRASADDLITLVYTSGTTGPPKGVELTHGNLFHVCESVKGLLPFGEEDRGLVFLPLAHILQRYITYLGLRAGISGYYVTDLSELPERMRSARPTVLAAVPRVLEKIQSTALATAASMGGLRERVFHRAFELGMAAGALERSGRRPALWTRALLRVADRLVFRKVRDRLGGSVKVIVSGGAPLAPHLSEWFAAAGILVIEGYGLTETSAPAATNRPDLYRFGSVGPAIPGTQVRIASDGEIEIRGPGVFRGYYRDPQATAEAFTPDGFFRSGDIGELDSDGFLRITGRKKNIIITAGGKNIGPGRIENRLKDHLLVGQAMVVGDQKPYLVAWFSLDHEDAITWAAAEGILETDLSRLARHPRVVESITSHVHDVNAGLAPYETIKRWGIADRPFLPENGYLTPTLKLRRRAILADYGPQIEALYTAPRG